MITDPEKYRPPDAITLKKEKKDLNVFCQNLTFHKDTDGSGNERMDGS